MKQISGINHDVGTYYFYMIYFPPYIKRGRINLFEMLFVENDWDASL